MGDSDKGVIALLTGGVLYGILKLGDELVVVSDDVLRPLLRGLDNHPFLISPISNIGQEIAEMELTVETLVLGLLAFFLLLAIADYISTEL